MTLSKTLREIVVNKTIEQLDSDQGQLFLDQRMDVAISFMPNKEELEETLTPGDRRQMIDELREELRQHLRLFLK
jgi:hypothetical protein